MRGAVKSITADLVALVKQIGQTLEMGVRRHGLVVCRIENGRVRRPGEHLLRRMKPTQVVRVVQRRQLAAVLDTALDLGSDQR